MCISGQSLNVTLAEMGSHWKFNKQINKINKNDEIDVMA